jgi:hypothetical protein
MASRFESTYQERVLPAAFRAFGQSVDLISADDASEYRITAMVELDEVPQGDGFQQITGRLSAKTSDLARISDTFGSITKVRFKEQIFDVYGKATDHAGITVLNISRKSSEQGHTNIFDINGEQAVWSS